MSASSSAVERYTPRCNCFRVAPRTTARPVYPGCRRWREVNMPVWAAREPGLDPRRLVGRIVVQPLGHLRVNPLQEVEEFGGPVTRRSSTGDDCGYKYYRSSNSAGVVGGAITFAQLYRLTDRMQVFTFRGPRLGIMILSSVRDH